MPSTASKSVGWHIQWRQRTVKGLGGFAQLVGTKDREACHASKSIHRRRSRLTCEWQRVSVHVETLATETVHVLSTNQASEQQGGMKQMEENHPNPLQPSLTTANRCHQCTCFQSVPIGYFSDGVRVMGATPPCTVWAQDLRTVIVFTDGEGTLLA